MWELVRGNKPLGLGGGLLGVEDGGPDSSQARPGTSAGVVKTILQDKRMYGQSGHTHTHKHKTHTVQSEQSGAGLHIS